MIKRYTIRKLGITTFALLVILLYVAFPVKEETFDTTVNYVETAKLDYVYLCDKNDYITVVMLNIDNTKEEEKIKEKINILIKNGIYKNKVPHSFEALIPENTKINTIVINNNLVTIDFSKELLQVSKENEEKMIEAIIFTVTENSNINSVTIKVEGKILTELPNSKSKLPEVLTRKYGINKKYDITSLNNIKSTTVFYLTNIDDNIYYTPVSLFTNDSRESVSIIIDELKSTDILKTNLKSYLDPKTELVSFEEVDNIMYLIFNEGIIDDVSNNILESVKYTISMSVKENYDVKDVIIKTK